MVGSVSQRQQSSSIDIYALTSGYGHFEGWIGRNPVWEGYYIYI